MREDAPLKTPRSSSGLLAAATWLLGLLAAAPAWGQRTQFPNTSPAVSPFDRTQPAPAVTLGDNIVPPGGWDPYDANGAPQPQMAPQTVDPYGVDPYGQPNPSPYDQSINGAPAPERLIQQMKAEYTMLGHTGSTNNFQVQDLEFSVTAAFPFMFNVAPLLVTPGFNMHFWSGPGNSAADLPPRVYDLYVDLGWRPQITPWASLDLGIRPGLFGDFTQIDSKAFRIQGRALGIFTISPQVQAVGGILFIDRYTIKLLPAGGIIWTPNEDSRYEILFPRPKLSQRITTVGNTDWWVYLAGEYGGGAWSVTRPIRGRDAVEYDDFRVALGTEWFNFSGLKGYFEIGFVFNRELRFVTTNNPASFYPNNTYMFRAGILF